MANSERSLSDLVAYVLTFNEEHNVRGVVHSLQRVTKTVVIVDSNSTDRTREVAARERALVWKHDFESFSDQRNWAIERITGELQPEWILSLDADERLTASLVDEIDQVIGTGDSNEDAFLIRRQLVFAGRLLRFGGFSRTRLIRLFRPSAGRYEEREVNEHFVPRPSARLGRLRYPIVHQDVYSWSRYIDKHNRYSTLEAQARWERISGVTKSVRISEVVTHSHLRRRWLRERVLNQMPGKSLARFIHIYIVLGGFLDGSAGFKAALFQAWQEMCIDLKFKELAARRSESGLDASHKIGRGA